ncbi:MAG: aconitate hydratase AcnA [Burkholderiales bacterium]
MNSPPDPFNVLRPFGEGSARGTLFSLPQLERQGLGNISRLPVSLRIVLEAVLRNCDGKRITEAHVRNLATWQPRAQRSDEIPFVVARILLQDFTGVPLLVDLAAMRNAAQRLGLDPRTIEPLVPVDLVIDHSVQVDHYNTPEALKLNMEIELQRNRERYQFLKWGMQAFKTFKVIPPGVGIVHQVNLEHLAQGVLEKNGVYYPDSVLGTDSHTTMINGLGVVGWGVGGIEAEVGMLGQPVYFLTPDVVGVHMTGSLRAGVTATDLVLRVTELLRESGVVGKFVEYFGAGAAALSLPNRATVANMAPEYGATMGFFPPDAETLDYLAATGRSAPHIHTVRSYLQAQGLFGMPGPGDIDYSQVIELDLGSVVPGVAGPKRPQDRIDLHALKHAFNALLAKSVAENGYGKTHAERRFQLAKPVPLNKDNVAVTEHTQAHATDIGHGDVLIAAITSCTNTSNPEVIIAAALLARNALQKGLKVNPRVKTSFAPGSRAVTEYLQRAGLQQYLDQLGFGLVGYGCTTCIGNSGPLDAELQRAISEYDVIAASVLSGNRNFEARVHPAIKANFLMSPPLVVAFALAGRVNIDVETESLGRDRDGAPVYLRDIWPAESEISSILVTAKNPAIYRGLYAAGANPLWDTIACSSGALYEWDGTSTYIREPPFFRDFERVPGKASDIRSARVLCILGDSVTTDHISPAASIKPSSPAGSYLKEHGVSVVDFNSYGARRGNHEVMLRGTFANVRIRNLMIPDSEGGITLHQPSGEAMPIYHAAMRYQGERVPLIVFAGAEYGNGSSRDWAAKGPQLLGVKAVIAKSFERIHRSNLIGMGILPCQFLEGQSAQTFHLDGNEEFDLIGIEDGIQPQQRLSLVVRRKNGTSDTLPILLRIDTPIEVEYYRHGGILPYVLRELPAR